MRYTTTIAKGRGYPAGHVSTYANAATFKGLAALDEFCKGHEYPVGHISTYADGSRWQKTSRGWIPAPQHGQAQIGLFDERTEPPHARDLDPSRRGLAHGSTGLAELDTLIVDLKAMDLREAPGYKPDYAILMPDGGVHASLHEHAGKPGKYVVNDFEHGWHGEFNSVAAGWEALKARLKLPARGEGGAIIDRALFDRVMHNGVRPDASREDRDALAAVLRASRATWLPGKSGTASRALLATLEGRPAATTGEQQALLGVPPAEDARTAWKRAVARQEALDAQENVTAPRAAPTPAQMSEDEFLQHAQRLVTDANIKHVQNYRRDYPGQTPERPAYGERMYEGTAQRLLHAVHGMSKAEAKRRLKAARDAKAERRSISVQAGYRGGSMFSGGGGTTTSPTYLWDTADVHRIAHAWHKDKAGMKAHTGLELLKAMATGAERAGHKYTRRTPDGKGGWRYVYDEPVRGYKMEVHGGEDDKGALAQKLAEGIKRSADLCKIDPPVCKDNLGIPRDKMPQLDEAVTARFLADLKAKGVQITNASVEVGRLKASQKEINAEKVKGMYEAWRAGVLKDSTLKNPIIVSKDGYIVDGHHRWATLLVHSPHEVMAVHRVDLPIRDLLHRANSFEGVEQRGLTDNNAKKPQDDAAAKKEAGERRRKMIEGMPAPKELPEQHERYFRIDKDTVTVPIGKLQNIRARPDGIENGAKYMRLAYDGKLDTRAPISLKKNKDGTYTILDGNSTYAIAKKYGWKSLPGKVVENETAQKGARDGLSLLKGWAGRLA